MNYDFEQLEDLDRFWHDLYEISIATNLGLSSGLDGKEVLIEDLNKKSAMIASLVGRSVDEVEIHELDEIPGDQRGAAGNAFFQAEYNHDVKTV